jgi:hypothetical protein
MRGYAKIALVSILMMGSLAAPNLSPATDGSSNRDGDGRHRLLNAELRSKVEDLRNKIAEHREHQHNQGGSPGSLQALQTEVASLRTALDVAKTQLLSLAADLSAMKKGAGGGSADPVLAELAKYVKVDPNPINGLKGPHVIFHGANVHVQSGSNTTADAGGLTGLGNLIVGYNEICAEDALLHPFHACGPRDGSHNLVVGPSHGFTSTGGVVFGKRNWISGQYATNLGGYDNWSTAFASSNLGGTGVTLDTERQSYP